MAAAPLRCIAVLTLVFLLEGLFVNPANAARVRFGAREELHVFAPTKVVAEGKTLSLCYKTYTYFLLAGIYTTDEVVLCDGSKDRYWSLPSNEKIEQFQNANLLPKPIPSYKRPLIDYMFGYSLWILLALMVPLSFAFKRHQKVTAKSNALQFRSTVRCIMARMVDSSANSGRTIAIARELFFTMFQEPLRDDEFVTDLTWVRAQPMAYDGFIGAIGRKYSKPAKVSLLRLAASLVMVEGTLQPSEQAAVVQLAERFGIRPQEYEAIVDGMRTALSPEQAGTV